MDSAYSSKELYLRYGITSPEYRYTDSEGHLLTKDQALCNCRYKYLKGELVEIMVTSAPVFNAHGYEPLKADRRSRRSADQGFDPDQQEHARRRASRRLRDLIRCNDWGYFVTLTFDGDLIDRTDYAAVCRRINQYLDNRVRRQGWKYVGVVEYHKKDCENGKKGLHYHFLVNGDLRLVDSGCVLRPDRKRPIYRTTAHRQGYLDDVLKTVYNISDWKLGYSTAIAVYGDGKALARYVAKYLTKSEIDKIGGRWFYHGGDLNEPEYKYAEVDFDRFDGDVLLDTDGGYVKIAYFD